jgi:hypothetical protein
MKNQDVGARDCLSLHLADGRKDPSTASGPLLLAPRGHAEAAKGKSSVFKHIDEKLRVQASR